MGCGWVCFRHGGMWGWGLGVGVGGWGNLFLGRRTRTRKNVPKVGQKNVPKLQIDKHGPGRQPPAAGSFIESPFVSEFVSMSLSLHSLLRGVRFATRTPTQHTLFCTRRFVRPRRGRVLGSVQPHLVSAHWSTRALASDVAQVRACFQRTIAASPATPLSPPHHHTI